MITIIDYGLGNLGSIVNMFKVIGEKAIVSSSREDLMKADGIILPGVGAFDAGMEQLNGHGLDKCIKEYAESGRPILGICLGMQMLGMKSEEGKRDGLGLIPFECVRFCFDDSSLKIPHMGWDIVDIKKDHAIVKELNGIQRYYFVHSFHAVCDSKENVLMSCYYGYEFVAAVVKENIVGVQFHPEKSHDFGIKLLRNFAKMCKEG